MSTYETLTLLISLVAAVVATVALIRGNAVARKQLEMQEKQANFAELQHKLLVLEQQSRMRADIRAAFIKDGRGHKFILKNTGAAVAKRVRLTGGDGSAAPECLVRNQWAELFPMPELKPNETITMIAALFLSMKLPADMIVTWDDESGTDRQAQLKVQVQGAV